MIFTGKPPLFFPGSFISDVFSRNNVQRAATSQKVNEASASEDENNSAAPYFDLNHSGNVTAVLGKTALLNCRVKNIGNKTVRREWRRAIRICVGRKFSSDWGDMCNLAFIASSILNFGLSLLAWPSQTKIQNCGSNEC